ncbi:MAG: hypothetical protein ABII64_02645 [Elusimicrobiota bacterium]
MSIFEAVMLLCFGAAWPFSIYKSYKSRKNAGKSVIFLYILLAGYASGFVHKLFYSRDNVIYLYVMNGFMVLADIIIYYRNRRNTNG